LASSGNSVDVNATSATTTRARRQRGDDRADQLGHCGAHRDALHADANADRTTPTRPGAALPPVLPARTPTVPSGPARTAAPPTPAAAAARSSRCCSTPRRLPQTPGGGSFAGAGWRGPMALNSVACYAAARPSRDLNGMSAITLGNVAPQSVVLARVYASQLVGSSRRTSCCGVGLSLARRVAG